MKKIAIVAACLALAWPAASAERPFGGLAKLPNNQVIVAGRVDIKPESPLPSTGGLVVGTTQEYVITNGVPTCSGGCFIAAPMNVTVAVFLKIGTVYRQVVPTFRAAISDAVLTEITLEDLYQAAHTAVTVDADVLREGSSVLLLIPGGGTAGQVLSQTAGALTWATPAAGEGDIAGVTAGTGLTGGGTTGTVTVSLTTPVSAANGGTGVNSSVWTGVPKVTAGTWASGATAADVGAAATSHAHAGADITSGTVGVAYLGTQPYGELYERSTNSLALSVLNTWYQWTSSTAGLSSGTTLSTATDSITVDTGNGGTYRLTLISNTYSQSTARMYQGGIAVNGTVDPGTVFANYWNGLTTASHSTVHFVALAAGDVLTVWYRETLTAPSTLNIIGINLLVERVGP